MSGSGIPIRSERPIMAADSLDLVLVVDFGAQYAQLIARRVREAHVYSEIVPRTMPIAEMLARRPKGIILSGGPASVHVEDAPSIDPAIYDARRPGARHLLRRAARRAAARRRGARRPAAASTAAPRSRRGDRARVLFDGLPGRADRLDEPRRRDRQRARRLRRHRVVARARRSPRSRTATAASTACSSTPRSRTPSAARRS